MIDNPKVILVQIYPFIKRLIDITASAAGLLLLSPLLALVTLMIRLTMGKPVIFKQVRPGLNEKPFTIYKFRTMSDIRGPDCSLLQDGERLTKLGKFLRKNSLDELPELWNVLKGDMSLAGPRPLLMEYLNRYTAEQARRHEVNPGITGWTQVNGRNAISWEKKFELDVWYIGHQSFWLDIKILWLTLIKVLRREGISAPGEATMPLFMGTQNYNAHKEN